MISRLGIKQGLDYQLGKHHMAQLIRSCKVSPIQERVFPIRGKAFQVGHEAGTRPSMLGSIRCLSEYTDAVGYLLVNMYYPFGETLPESIIHGLDYPFGKHQRVRSIHSCNVLPIREGVVPHFGGCG